MKALGAILEECGYLLTQVALCAGRESVAAGWEAVSKEGAEVYAEAGRRGGRCCGRSRVINKALKWFVINVPLRTYNLLGRLYLAPILWYEWRRVQKYSPNERPVEYAYALGWLWRNDVKTVLDVGTGVSSWAHLLAGCYFRVTAIDRIKGYWRGGYFNRHFRVVNDDITNPAIKERFDAITCLSVLEHIVDHRAAMKGMFKLLNPGGHLVLSFPYNENRYVENAYSLADAGYGQDKPYICQVFSRKEINEWVAENSGRIVDQQYYRVFEGEFWACGCRLYPCVQVERQERCHLTCLIIQKN